MVFNLKIINFNAHTFDMMRFYLSILLVVSGILSFSQNLNELSGQWKMEYQPWPHIPPIDLEINIYHPVSDMIFPSRMNLTYGNFKGQYDFILVKKGENLAGIARNKIPLLEQPFSLGPWMMYLNGHFEIHSEKKQTKLSLKRLWIEEFGIFMKGVYDDEMQTNTKVFIRDFLYNADISLSKIQSNPGKHPNESEIINSKEIYYGIYDPIEVHQPEIQISVLDEERYDKDSVTIVHNGKIIADKIMVGEASFLENIKLEKGDNFIAFFAENYGDLPPNTANFLVYSEGAKEPQYSFDFTHKSNAYATAMVAHFIYNPEEKENIPDKPQESFAETTDGRKNLKVGNLTAHSATVYLEVWDAKKEDGDVVSIYLNDKKISEKLEVKHEPKRIEIELKCGKNTILFKAENLGNVPPNTAALKIYGNGFEKIIQLNTDFKRNNLVEIQY